MGRLPSKLSPKSSTKKSTNFHLIVRRHEHIERAPPQHTEPDGLGILRLLETPSTSNHSLRRRELHQEVALTIFLAVTVVEIFLNGYFRVVVSEAPFQHCEKDFLKDIDARISLERKCREWPRRILGASLDPTNDHVKAFMDLKDLRNKLVHFVSSHESMELPDNITIHGLADTTAYRTLTSEVAVRCLETVKSVAYEIFRLRGIQPSQCPHAFHAWFGEVPSNRRFQTDRFTAAEPES